MHNTSEFHYYPNFIEAGCDEAERGCSTGSMFTSTVIPSSSYDNAGLSDPRQLSRRKRGVLYQAIISNTVVWAVGEVTLQEIDEINTLRISFLAMHRALDQLTMRPQAIIMDGNHFMPYHDLPYTTTTKGDGKYQDIAAANILAKIFRDDYMNRLAQEYPQYGW